jgi:hypothetical protein
MTKHRFGIRSIYCLGFAAIMAVALAVPSAGAEQGESSGEAGLERIDIHRNLLCCRTGSRWPVRV